VDLGLTDKHVFIAGASRGIGLGIAEAFLNEGARVSLTARNAETLESSFATLATRYGKERLFRRAGDMTQTEAIVAALEDAEAALGPVHCVIGNVGIDQTPPGWNVDDKTFDVGFAQNCLGSYRLAREVIKRVLPRPPESREGFNIIFISSGAGIEAVKSPLTYGSSKAMLNHITKELAKLLGKDGIRVNAVCPAMTVFPGGGWEKRLQSAERDYWLQYCQRETALQRFGTPEEAADVTVYLASKRASIITGSIVVADAGQMR
jgi:3-oxoacyl-[acyl-carrier protein] reductase